MSPAEREILENFRAVLKEKLTLHSLALFGSRAREDAGEDSDMDVLSSRPAARRLKITSAIAHGKPPRPAALFSFLLFFHAKNGRKVRNALRYLLNRFRGKGYSCEAG